jgi:phosphomevalonate kinase
LTQQEPQSVPLDPGKKTGLGSSAALIASFVASTFEVLGILPEDRDSKLRMIHIYSQILNAFV